MTIFTEEQQKALKELIKKEVQAEKKKLSEIVNDKLLYTGEFAKAHRLMTAIEKWAKD